ncbi:MAG: DMT family transporter [Pseudomonadales bacterium]
MYNERNALVMAMGAVIMWSTVTTGFKLGLEVMEPVQLLFMGTVLSSAVFAIVASRQGWPGKHFQLREGMRFALINPILYYLVLLEAYDRLPAQIAQPLNYTWAIMLAVLAVPVLGQKLTRQSALGIALGYLGVLVLLSQGRFDALPDVDWFGVALALGSTLLWAGYWLFNARSSTEPAALMATSFVLAIPLLGLLCVVGPGLPQWQVETFIYGGWVGLIEMGITFLLWQRALKLSNHAARIGQLIFLSPFLSLLLIGSVLGETIHYTSWIGLLIIVAGLVITRQPTRNS